MKDQYLLLIILSLIQCVRGLSSIANQSSLDRGQLQLFCPNQSKQVVIRFIQNCENCQENRHCFWNQKNGFYSNGQNSWVEKHKVIAKTVTKEDGEETQRFFQELYEEFEETIYYYTYVYETVSTSEEESYYYYEYLYEDYEYYYEETYIYYEENDWTYLEEYDYTYEYYQSQEEEEESSYDFSDYYEETFEEEEEDYSYEYISYFEEEEEIIFEREDFSDELYADIDLSFEDYTESYEEALRIVYSEEEDPIKDEEEQIEFRAEDDQIQQQEEEQDAQEQDSRDSSNKGIQELRRKRRSKKVWRRRKITIPVDIESGEEEYKEKKKGHRKVWKTKTKKVRKSDKKNN